MMVHRMENAAFRIQKLLIVGCLLAWASAAASADCIVNAHSTARIGAPSKGIIARLRVERSDKVKAGDIIAELEASAEDAAVALARLAAENDLPIQLARRRAETAELQVTRQERLDRSSLTSKTELERAILEAQTARLEEAEARLAKRQAEQELANALEARERRRIRAPFDGVVTARLMSPGELYAEQGPILVIAKIDPLFVETYLPLDRLSDVALGDNVAVTLETGAKVQAEISVIDPVLDAATGTFGVRLILPNPDGRILAGQSCVANFSVGN